MATIVTVHGTFTTGDEYGTNWWQKGSEFESDLKRYVEPEAGGIDFVPFIWDGLNSEMSRRKAGQRLATALFNKNAPGAPFIAIGHSHGGSVIGQALLRCPTYGNRINNIARWITVGTPFIQTVRRGLLYSRLPLVSRAIYTSILTIFLCFAVTIFIEAIITLPQFNSGAERELTASLPKILNDAMRTHRDEAIVAALISLCFILLIPLGLAHVLFWFQDRRMRPAFIRKIRTAVQSRFGNLWLPMSHPNDEAIQGLQMADRFKPEIFHRDFASQRLSAVSVLLAPLGVYFLASLLPIDRDLVPAQLKDTWLVPFLNLQSILVVVNHSIQAVYPLGNGLGFFLVLALELCLLALVFSVITYVSVLIVNKIAGVVSSLISRRLNKLASSELKQSVLGGDVVGESALKSASIPIWSSAIMPDLPTELSAEIEAVSDVAAATSWHKFRSNLQNLLNSREKPGLLSGYLSWEELIHTTYFKVPRFRKLVCYAVAQSQGFRPAKALLDDADYPLLKSWYDELARGNRAAIIPTSKAS